MGNTRTHPEHEAHACVGLVYESVWVQDFGVEILLDEMAGPRKRKVVEVRCSCCGETRCFPWARTDEQRGGYLFLCP